MRGRWLIWTCLGATLAGCQFDVSGIGSAALPDAASVPLPDAAIPGDAPAAADAAPAVDAAPGLDAAPLCATALRVWEADFSTDPTGRDGNGDGVDDWIVRNGGTFPEVQLAGGVWQSLPNIALDTQPKDDFDGLTIAEVRMRNTAAGGEGAVFWINADASGDEYAPIYVALALQLDGSQTARVHGKRNNSTTELLYEETGLGAGFIDVRLEIDAVNDQVGVWLDGVHRGTRGYFSFPRPDDNRFATLIAYSSASEFDRVRIETCAP